MTVDMITLARAVDVGLRILTVRIMALLALLMAFALFAWAMYLQNQQSLWIAGAFAVLVFLPVLLLGRTSKEVQDNANV